MRFGSDSDMINFVTNSFPLQDHETLVTRGSGNLFAKTCWEKHTAQIINFIMIFVFVVKITGNILQIENQRISIIRLDSMQNILKISSEYL